MAERIMILREAEEDKATVIKHYPVTNATRGPAMSEHAPPSIALLPKEVYVDDIIGGLTAVRLTPPDGPEVRFCLSADAARVLGIALTAAADIAKVTGWGGVSEDWMETETRSALGEVADLPPAIATCAECGATTPARWSSEVYPDGPTDEPFLVIDGPSTGWRAWADRYWCAAHADAPARYALDEAAWMSRRDVAIAEWEQANPRPAVSSPTPGGE